jgi:hypothetical protein
MLQTIINDWQNQDDIKNMVLRRWEFVHTESMEIFYFLDPETKGGRDMIGDDRLDSISQLENFNLNKKKISIEKDKVSFEIEKFTEMVFNPSNKIKNDIENKSVTFFWNVVGSEYFPILKKVADIVFNIPTSQAESERVLGIFDFIHTKRRNRLPKAKVHKLVSLYADASINNDEANLINIMMGIEDDEM